MAGSIHGLYVIIDPDACSGRAVADVARDALAGGASAIQWRDKQRPLGDQLDDALAIAALCSKYGALFIVNDHVDFALACDADGVHLGQHDLPIERVRPIAGDGLIIGVSTNNVEEALQAEALGADYVAIGAIFATSSKLDTRPANLARLNEIKLAVKVPVVAIGGINATNIGDVIASGADAVAVISAVCAASDVTAAATELAATFKAGVPTAPSRTTMLLLADAYISALNRRDLGAFLELFAADGVIEDPLSAAPHIGLEAIAQWWESTGISHRPFSINVKNVAATGMEMALVWNIRHEHENHEVAVAYGVEIISVENNGRIASVHSLWDRPGQPPEEDARRMARLFLEAVNARDRQAFVSLWSEHAIRQDPGQLPTIGIEAVADHFDRTSAAWPGLTLRADNICVAHREAALVWTATQPQGTKSRTLEGVHVITLDDDGKIGSIHSYWDPDNPPDFE